MTVEQPRPAPADQVRPDPTADFRHLPDPVALEDTVSSQDVNPVPDPDGGRDPNHEWMPRHG